MVPANRATAARKQPSAPRRSFELGAVEFQVEFGILGDSILDGCLQGSLGKLHADIVTERAVVLAEHLLLDDLHVAQLLADGRVSQFLILRLVLGGNARILVLHIVLDDELHIGLDGRGKILAAILHSDLLRRTALGAHAVLHGTVIFGIAAVLCAAERNSLFDHARRGSGPGGLFRRTARHGAGSEQESDSSNKGSFHLSDYLVVSL